MSSNDWFDIRKKKKKKENSNVYINLWKYIMEINPTAWKKIEKHSNPKVMNLL